MWPSDAEELVERQRMLAGLVPQPWRPGPHQLRFGGCWVCFPRGDSGPGDAGDLAPDSGLTR
jgi:deoxyribonuclease V